MNTMRLTVCAYLPKKSTITQKSPYKNVTITGKLNPARVNTLNTTTQNTPMVSYTVNFFITEKIGIAVVTTSAMYMPKSGDSGTAVQKAAQGRIKSHIARILGLLAPNFSIELFNN
jgi:hypothetical protein